MNKIEINLTENVFGGSIKINDIEIPQVKSILVNSDIKNPPTTVTLTLFGDVTITGEVGEVTKDIINLKEKKQLDISCWSKETQQMIKNTLTQGEQLLNLIKEIQNRKF